MTSTEPRTDEQDLTTRDRRWTPKARGRAALVAALVLVTVAVFAGAEAVGLNSRTIFIDALRTATGPSAAVYALLAIGLNMHFGYTGLLNFGQVGFMLVGAYGVAISVSTFGLPLWVGVLVSVGLAVVLALLLGAPTLRLRADYLAITTIAAAEILRFVFRASDARPLTGGVFGLRGFAGEFYRVNPFPADQYDMIVLPAGLLWLIVVAVLAGTAFWVLPRTAWGGERMSGRLLHLGRGATVGAIAGVVVGYGLPLANPIPAGAYRLPIGTVSHVRLWGLVVVVLVAAAVAAMALAQRRHRSWTKRSERLAWGGVAGAVLGALLTRAFFALNPIPAGDYGPALFALDHRRVWVIIVGWALVVVMSLFMWGLMRSPWGRVIKSIREDEDAARSLGKNVFSYKMQSLVIGGVIGAFGGVVFALTLQTVQPDTFLPQLTFFAYTVLILGGAARILGPVVGSVIFWFIVAGFDSFLRRAASADLLPAEYFGSGSIGAVRFAFVGLGLMLLMIYRPQGLLGDRREMQLDVK